MVDEQMVVTTVYNSLPANFITQTLFCCNAEKEPEFTFRNKAIDLIFNLYISPWKQIRPLKKASGKLL